MITVLVIAGNFGQYNYYINVIMHEQFKKEFKKISDGRYMIDGCEYRYFNVPQNIRGFSKFKVVKYGTYYNKPFIHEMLDLVDIYKQSGDCLEVTTL